MTEMQEGWINFGPFAISSVSPWSVSRLVPVI